jgi:hypothetical protein
MNGQAQKHRLATWQENMRVFDLTFVPRPTNGIFIMEQFVTFMAQYDSMKKIPDLSKSG